MIARVISLYYMIMTVRRNTSFNVSFGEIREADRIYPSLSRAI